ncbi:polysaccharide pyruvyl transferase family protein [Hymenobacter sp. B81]|uniref:polysaccharide pyruvyl transferase family protein n=1 Tax=Hymenobacter sp. B81 TaxID=3344878 RepID=UPI0037DD7ED4
MQAMPTITFQRRVLNKVKRVLGLGPLEEYPHTKGPYLLFNHVDLYYWRPLWTYEQNFGDHLSKIIVSKVLADGECFLEEETPKSRRMFAIGSIMHVAQNDEVIWGSGVHGNMTPEAHTFQRLDVRAVRGPLTRKFLMERGIQVPEVYGDPALLLPHIFPTKFKRESKLPYAVVPHHTEYDMFVEKNTPNLISPMGSWNGIITQILQADYVISSSLHGIIIAEAYGIPARYLRVTENQDLFKYNDYMMGTGRGEIKFATTVEEALQMGPQEPPVFDHRQLLAAFPWDLWGK